eukprot:3377107-Rhodomonas_salina.9
MQDRQIWYRHTPRSVPRSLAAYAPVRQASTNGPCKIQYCPRGRTWYKRRVVLVPGSTIRCQYRTSRTSRVGRQRS